jgi:molybdopterin-guanine dinucleotide biosynthesis protein A
MERTLGVLVAGGRGARLGLAGPKAFAEVGGVSLLARAVRVLESVCDAIVIAAPRGCELPRHAYARVDDVAGAGGPLAGLVAGLAARPFDRAVALGVDFPFMSPAALGAMLACLPGHAAALPSPRGVPQPLAAAYAPAAAPALAAALARGERALTPAVLALDALLLDEAASARIGGDDPFFNLNTPADLEEARRRIDSIARAEPGR